MTGITLMEAFWRILPAVLIAPFITFFLGRLGNITDRKLEYRTFFDVDEVTANYKLKNMPNLKNGTKLIIPNQFISLEKEIENRIRNKSINPSKIQLAYLHVKPFGNGIITGSSISVTLRSVDKKESWKLDISLPILEQNEEIFIPMDRLDMYEIEFFIEEIEMKYRTQAGEKMLYKSTRRKIENNETIVKISYSVKKFNLFYYPIDNQKGRNAGWIFLTNDKDKSSGT
ncbi:hypothetical protein GJU41_00110 [Bacillus idriensis]|uniref:Uncharacterized protein n=1 Tax=Metabacillus idriensis TaxID=324768 RepID=A0A6I2M2S4_9BACI|nr:hypothetical protein [Metabacillus idriensis]MRX52358.1 hypothetical protein [Metabacillus idriensis]